MKNKFAKFFVFIFAIGFSVSFFVLSQNFFDAFSFAGRFVFNPTKMFYVSLFLLVFAVIFDILLFALILSKKKATTKLFCSIVPITLLFVVGLYYLVIDSTPNKTLMAFNKSINTTPTSVTWAIVVMAGVYLVVLFVVIINILKPIKQIQRAVVALSNGYSDQNFVINSGKDFAIISKGLNKINYNYKQNQLMFDKLNDEYSKYLPTQFVKQLGKKSVLDLSLGCNIQKEITSMFVDIRNSTKTSLTLSLADNFNFINRYLGIIGPIVRKYDGFVDKYLGDGVLAIFTDPNVAINCANEIVRSVDRDSQDLGLYNVKIGIGIHTGQVVMGVIGEKKRLSATVIADSVNTASYLEKLNTKLGTTVIFTKQTLNALNKDNNLNYRYVGCFELGSAKDKVSIFESLDCYNQTKKDLLVSTKKDFENAVRCFELGGDNCKKYFKSCISKDNPDYVCNYYLKKHKERKS